MYAQQMVKKKSRNMLFLSCLSDNSAIVNFTSTETNSSRQRWVQAHLLSNGPPTQSHKSWYLKANLDSKQTLQPTLLLALNTH